MTDSVFLWAELWVPWKTEHNPPKLEEPLQSPVAYDLGCTLQTVMGFHVPYQIKRDCWWRFSLRKLASLVNAIEVNNCLNSMNMLSLGRSPSPSYFISATTATSCSVDNFVMRCWWFNKLAKSSWNAWKTSSLLGFTGTHWTLLVEWSKFLPLAFRNPQKMQSSFFYRMSCIPV